MKLAAKVSEEPAIGLGEEAKAFMEKFGSHLLMRSFDGMNAMQLEDIATGISDESHGIIKPEEVQKIPLEDQRQMHDQRWLSTVAWMWAANAYVAGNNGEQFDEMIENALSEFTRMPYFEQGSYLKDAKKTEAVLRNVRAGGHLNEVFNFIVNAISQNVEDISIVNCGYSVAEKVMMYNTAAQYEFMRAAVKYAVGSAGDIGFAVPKGKKEESIDNALASLSETPGIKTPVKGFTSALKKVGSAVTGEAKALAERKAGLQRQRDAYHPSDDAQIHESEAGRVRFRFMGYEFGVYDMLVNGNMMRFETRLRRLFASHKVEDLKFIRRDLALPDDACMDVKSYFENLKSGEKLGGYDNNTVMWRTSDADTITQYPGAYRKNAFGVFIAKAK